jgi:protein-S-isoprenylcysteine O-methyltransferase Ste14
LNWWTWLEPYPTFRIIWGIVILLAVTVFSWVTLSFGMRFSNLTHRGIIRTGPYYFTKHPGYIAKLSTFFLVSIPFVPLNGWQDALQRTLLLGLVAVVYRTRAKTEERHLSADPTYRQYCEEIETRHNRWFAFIGRLKSK